MLQPDTPKQLLDIILEAVEHQTPLEILGNGTKKALGHNVMAQKGISTARLSGISLYEPSELVITAGAGTKLEDISAVLEKNGQEFAFEPIDYGVLYGVESQAVTLGGVIGVNASGSRRIKAGAARDHMLGFQGVTGRGEEIASGGRVMKNVTGYDLCKLMCGSFGTLVALTEITMKVLPRADTEKTLAFVGMQDHQGIRLMCRAFGLPYEISSACHCPQSVTARLEGITTSQALTLLRFEGPEISVKTRIEKTLKAFEDQKSTAGDDVFSTKESQLIWKQISNAHPLASLEADIWRLSVAPTQGAHTLEKLLQSGVDVLAHYYDWSGGLVWLASAPASDSFHTRIRSAVNALGGHASLVRATALTHQEVPRFHPQAKALSHLTKRIKHSFDPFGILNPQRLGENL